MSEPKPERSLLDLARVGAENAESAFSLLVDRTLEMDAVRVEPGPPEGHPLDAAWECGVIFELDGALDALVALLFRAEQRDLLIVRMLGAEAGSMGDLAVESALMEVANIVASHVATAIAEVVVERLLPSVPMLAASDAAAQVEVVLRERGTPGPRFLSELRDPASALGALLVFVPDGAERPLR